MQIGIFINNKNNTYYTLIILYTFAHYVRFYNFKFLKNA